MRACEEQAQQKKQLLDETFGKERSMPLGLRLLASRTAEEEADLSRIARFEAQQQVSSSSSEEEDEAD